MTNATKTSVMEFDIGELHKPKDHDGIPGLIVQALIDSQGEEGWIPRGGSSGGYLTLGSVTSLTLDEVAEWGRQRWIRNLNLDPTLTFRTPPTWYRHRRNLIGEGIDALAEIGWPLRGGTIRFVNIR